MADNYLEKRYEEVFGRTGAVKKAPATPRPSLDTLLLKNRSCRGYDTSYVVHPIQMNAILSVNTKLASAGNAQRLRFHPVLKGEEADAVLSLIHLGAALPELHLPMKGTEPRAFIVVCSTTGDNSVVDIDLGISLQSMSLKAVELGLGCVIVKNFDADALKEALSLPLHPLAVLAVGKPIEKIILETVHEGAGLKYYRKEGIHYVPKLSIEDLII